jgi:hypothetical protein
MNDLELANASIRRGARLAQVGFPIFAILAVLVIANMDLGIGPVLPWAVILIAVTTTTAIVVQARRLSRLQLTAEGIQTADGSTIQWIAITRATYVNGLLTLHDGAGREIGLVIMLAISQAKVLAAVRPRLPRGIQIENDPSPGLYKKD